jgi:hypothetical protein
MLITGQIYHKIIYLDGEVKQEGKANAGKRISETRTDITRLVNTAYEQRKRKNYSDIEIKPSYIRCIFSLLIFLVAVFSSFRTACMAKFKKSTESSGCPQGKIQFTSSVMTMLTVRRWSTWL